MHSIRCRHLKPKYTKRYKFDIQQHIKQTKADRIWNTNLIDHDDIMQIKDGLSKHGYTVIPQFLSRKGITDAIDTMRTESISLYNAGKFFNSHSGTGISSKSTHT